MHTRAEDNESEQKTSHFQLSVLLVVFPTKRAARNGLKINSPRLFPRLVVGVFFLYVRIAGLSPLKLQRKLKLGLPSLKYQIAAF